MTLNLLCCVISQQLEVDANKWLSISCCLLKWVVCEGRGVYFPGWKRRWSLGLLWEKKEVALNLSEGGFLILHLDFSIGVGLLEQVMGL